MPVILSVTNDDGKNVVEEGIDLGLSRKGKPNDSVFYIENQGNTVAREVTLIGSALHSLEDVENNIISQEEYEKEQLAGKWKQFSLQPDSGFQYELNIGDIQAGTYLSGTQTQELSTQSEGLFPFNPVHTNANLIFKDNTFTYEKDSNGYASMRLQHKDPKIRSTKHFELTFGLAFEVNEDSSKWDANVPYFSIPVRNNSKGDGLGYGFLFAYNRENGTVVVSIQKDMVGITSHYDGLLIGTGLYQTQAIRLDNTREFTVKCYDVNNVPTFEVLYGGQNQRLYAMVGDASGNVVKDNSSTAYKAKGNFYLECTLQEGDISVSLKNMRLVSDLDKQPIYVRTTIDDRAEDKVQYNSSIAISYYED